MAAAHVQSIGNHAGTIATTVAVTLPSSVTVGSLGYCRVVWEAGTATCTVSDNRNGAWTPIGSPVNIAGAGRLQEFYCKNMAAGSTTITATTSTAVGYRNLAAGEWSGVDTVSPLVTNNTVTGSGTAPAVSLNTTGTDHCLIIGGCGCSGTGAAGSGFNSRVVQDGNVLEDKLDHTPAGTISVAFTMTPSGNWTATAAAFKTAGGATTDTPTAGVAVASGITPAASIAVAPSPGTATAAGTTLSSAATATPTMGVASGAGISPAHGATPVMGVATAAGIAPSDGTDETTETPGMGVAVAAGIAPATSLLQASGVGSAPGSGTSPAVSTTAIPIRGTATASGTSPAVSITRSPTPGVGVVSFVAPTTRVTVVPVRGIAIASGINPGNGATGPGVGPDTPREATFITVGATTATFETPAAAASLELPSTTAEFVRPAVAASFEQASGEIVLD